MAPTLDIACITTFYSRFLYFIQLFTCTRNARTRVNFDLDTRRYSHKVSEFFKQLKISYTIVIWT